MFVPKSAPVPPPNRALSGACRGALLAPGFQADFASFVALGFACPCHTPPLVSARANGGPFRVAPRWRIDRSMADRNPPEDDLSNLRRRVAKARGEGASTSRPPDSAASLALRFGGEFGAAVIVGALLGYGADIVLHSRPWGLVIGLVLGFVTGVVNVVRVAQSYSRANPPDPNARPIPDDDDD